MTKLTKMELKELVEQNEYEIKLVQYYEQIDSYKNLDDITQNTEIPGTQPTISVPGYRALLELYMASNDAPHKELENFSNSLEKISTYLFNDDHDKFTEQVFNDLEEKNKSFIFYSNFNNSHANFIKYSKENNQYYRTFYNVGWGYRK